LDHSDTLLSKFRL
jgi:Ca2+-binding EF-hand superfamily protein